MKLFSKLLLAFAILFGLPHFVSAQTPNGAALYASNCQGCHGSLAASNVSNRTFAGIKAAIGGNVGGMGFLASLTDAELQAISNALSPPAPPAAPALSVSPSLLSFSYQQGGSAPAAQSLSVASGGSYTAAKSASWLSISPTSGTTSGTVNVSVSSGMAAGTYTDNVTITASGATGSPKSIPVTLTVTAAAAAPNGAALYASKCQGCHGSLATSNILNRTVAGTKAAIAGNVGGMGFLSSLTDVELQAIANALSPPAPPAAPALSVSPSLLSFSYQQGGSAPAAQSLRVASGGR